MSESADGKLRYHITVERALAEQLVGHYHDNAEVGSVTDALREAGREIVDEDGDAGRE